MIDLVKSLFWGPRFKSLEDSLLVFLNKNKKEIMSYLAIKDSRLNSMSAWYGKTGRLYITVSLYSEAEQDNYSKTLDTNVIKDFIEDHKPFDIEIKKICKAIEKWAYKDAQIVEIIFRK